MSNLWPSSYCQPLWNTSCTFLFLHSSPWRVLPRSFPFKAQLAQGFFLQVLPPLTGTDCFLGFLPEIHLQLTLLGTVRICRTLAPNLFQTLVWTLSEGACHLKKSTCVCALLPPPQDTLVLNESLVDQQPTGPASCPACFLLLRCLQWEQEKPAAEPVLDGFQYLREVKYSRTRWLLWLAAAPIRTQASASKQPILQSTRW